MRWVCHLDWLSESVENLGFGSVVFELEAKIRPCHHFQKFHTVECKAFRSMFCVLFVGKYSKLTKFIQKIYPNSRKPRIFMDSVDKSAFLLYLGTAYSSIVLSSQTFL